MPWRCAIGFFQGNCGTNLVAKHAETRVEYRFKNPYAEIKCTDLLPLATAFCGLWKMHWRLPKSETMWIHCGFIHFGCGSIYGRQEMHKRMLQSFPCLFSLPISLFVAFWYVWLALPNLFFMFLGTWMPFFWSWKMHKHLLEPAWDFPIHPTGVESRVARWS